MGLSVRDIHRESRFPFFSISTKSLDSTFLEDVKEGAHFSLTVANLDISGKFESNVTPTVFRIQLPLPIESFRIHLESHTTAPLVVVFSEPPQTMDFSHLVGRTSSLRDTQETSCVR